LYRDAQIYKIWQTRRAFASEGFVKLGNFGSGDRPHSGLISFVMNIDFMRLAAIRDILPDRIWEIYPVPAATHLGMIILLCSGPSKFWAIGACPAAARVEPDGRV